MKKIIAIICSLSIVLCMLSSVVAFAGTQTTYTKVYPSKFLNQAGDGEYTVNPTDTSFPSWIQKVNTHFVPTEDPSNFNLGVGMKYTNPSENGRSEMYMSSMSYADAAGYIIRIKSDTTENFRLSFRILKNGTTAAYEWGGINWYILDSDDNAWRTAAVEGYGPTFEAGFDGYLYIPFETIKNPATFSNTDTINGIVLWKGAGFTDVNMSVPMFVDRATLDANNLPTADKVIVGETEHTYFEVSNDGGNNDGNGDGNDGGNENNDTIELPEYTGETIDYGQKKITKIKNMPIIENFNVGSDIPVSVVNSHGAPELISAVKNTNPMSSYPLVQSNGKQAGTTDAESCIYSIYADGSKSTGAEGLIMYVKLPEDAPATTVKTLYNFYAGGDLAKSRSAWQYSGTCWLLNKGDDEWKSTQITAYQYELPAGFDGFILIEYAQLGCEGQSNMTKEDALKQVNLYVPNWNGGKIHASIPWLITDIADRTTAVYLDDETKCARNLFNGNVVTDINGNGNENGGGNADGDDEVKLPEYTGETINYGEKKITKIKNMPIKETLNIGGNIPATIANPQGTPELLSAVKNQNPMSAYPLLQSSGKQTGYTNGESCVMSIYADGSKSTGAEGLIMYVKLPEDSSATTIETKFNFYAGGDLAKSRSAWQYAGKCWLLNKGDTSWKEVEVTAYQYDLPAGFDGFILIDYAQLACEGQNKLTKEDALKQINIYVPGWNGGTIQVSIPWLITDMGDRTTSVYLDDETKCARNLFNGSVIMADSFSQMSDSVNIGDKYDILPESTTDKVINYPDASDFGDTSVTLSWEAFDGAGKYRVELYSKTFTEFGLAYTVEDIQYSNTTSITLNSITPDITYSVVVRALDDAGNIIAVYESISIINSEEIDGYGDWDDEIFGDDSDDLGFGDESFDGSGFDDTLTDTDYEGLPTTGQSNAVYCVLIIFMLCFSFLVSYPLAKKE